jgi:phage terminase Nu1 subunit (DNA packaging protein)
MMLIDLSEKATQQGFGDVIGVGQSAVSEMISQEILSADGNLGTWIAEYCTHIRGVAAGRTAKGDIDLVTERALLAREQRMRIEMQNAVTRRELAPVVMIEEVLAKAGSRVAGILDAIPGMVKRRLPALTSDAIDLIRGEVAKARNVAAAVSLSDLREDVTPAEDEAPIEDEVVA